MVITHLPMLVSRGPVCFVTSLQVPEEVEGEVEASER